MHWCRLTASAIRQQGRFRLARLRNVVEMLAKAIEQSKSTDPLKVALALKA